MDKIEQTSNPAALKSVIYPKLSYQLMNVLFTVQNRYGNDLQEKIYQKAVANELENKKISFQREVYVALNDESGQAGSYFLDFVVENKIALELKAEPTIYKKDIRQILAYLSVTKLRLGIIVNFRTPRLTYKRVINAQIGF